MDQHAPDDDEEEGDFSYLVQELRRGVEATYDKVALIPGHRLWEQIADSITRSSLSGWAYLLTPNSLGSEACREELAYALYRALNENGSDFPLIGLLHGVSIEDVPPALRVRLCVSLASPTWKRKSRPPSKGVRRKRNRRLKLNMCGGFIKTIVGT